MRRRVLIKQSGGADERRYVVRMWVMLGEIRSKIDVNLSDRSDSENVPTFVVADRVAEERFTQGNNLHQSSPVEPASV